METVSVHADGATLHGDLAVGAGGGGLVVFAHGSGSSRFSRRNQQVAQFLQRQGHATLLLDLLTPDEERVDVVTRELRFDIELLGRRVRAAAEWALQRLGDHRIGLFGASTGAAAALIAAAERPDVVRAVVSRGGRPDLAMSRLQAVQAPTLFIVGGRDAQVLQLNEQAAAAMTAEHRLHIVPAATHLFEEPGALEQVSVLAAHWFTRHLTGG